MSAQYSDADNTTLVNDNTNGVQGVIPYYLVFDLSVAYEFINKIKLSLSLNNLTNEAYFTRRASGYPGPGILPAEGRRAFVSLKYTF